MKKFEVNLSVKPQDWAETETKEGASSNLKEMALLRNDACSSSSREFPPVLIILNKHRKSEAAPRNPTDLPKDKEGNNREWGGKTEKLNPESSKITSNPPGKPWGHQQGSSHARESQRSSWAARLQQLLASFYLILKVFCHFFPKVSNPPSLCFPQSCHSVFPGFLFGVFRDLSALKGPQKWWFPAREMPKVVPCPSSQYRAQILDKDLSGVGLKKHSTQGADGGLSPNPPKMDFCWAGSALLSPGTFGEFRIHCWHRWGNSALNHPALPLPCACSLPQSRAAISININRYLYKN